MKRKVTFLPFEIDHEVEEGTLISDAAKEARIEIPLPCGGRGRCGRCAVNIGGTCGDKVLACQVRVEEDMKIWVPPVKETGKVVVVKDHREIVLDDRTPISTGKGIAVDVGTTTIALEIVDMDKAIGLYTATGLNLQRSKGEDVLSRIQFAEDGGTKELRKLVMDSINDLLDTYVEGTKGITHVWVSGNTVMQELFAGNDPSYLRKAPYRPKDASPKVAPDSGLNVPRSAGFSFSPSPASYVGGDVMGGIVFSGMDKAENLSLLLDVGTNGEVALGNKDVMLVCSSSAGPAFEGANLESGMVSNIGAIDSVTLDHGKLTYTVIGDVEPKGICGSGVIDLVAELRSADYIDKKGNFTSDAKLAGDVFELAPGVGVSQNEIKDIILTKAAVFSAARALTRNLGVTFDDLEHIYIAGGFGAFINLDSAISIGLFPDVPKERYVYLGNASLAAARSALLSKGFRDRLSGLLDRTTYVDLSSNPEFFDEYMSAQFLPHTDAGLFPSLGN